MSLAGISFIGVDEMTNIDELFKLQELTDIPLEFGVLYSPKKNGVANRYPPNGWATAFAFEHGAESNLSLHLCGDSVDEFLTDWGDDSLYDGYSRLQLNFSINKYDEFDLSNKLIYLLQDIDIPIVVQYNKSKAKFLEEFINCDWNNKLHLLFDASGGFGKVLEKPQPAFERIYTGYAGGIGPDTVQEVLKKIIAVNNPETPFYIDMESGIRDENDWFSIEKCKQVIEKVNETL